MAFLPVLVARPLFKYMSGENVDPSSRRYQNFLELTTAFQGAPSESHGKVGGGGTGYLRAWRRTALSKLMGAPSGCL